MDRRNERLGAIAKYLRIQNGSTVRELSGYLGVSHMTVRRDLEMLEQQGIIRLFHGGAVYNRSVETSDGEYTLAAAGSRNVEKKRLIGRRAAALAEEGDVLIIDTGTTTEQMAQAPGSMQLRYLFSLQDIATDRSNVIVLPLPTDLLHALSHFGKPDKA